MKFDAEKMKSEMIENVKESIRKAEEIEAQAKVEAKAAFVELGRLVGRDVASAIVQVAMKESTHSTARAFTAVAKESGEALIAQFREEEGGDDGKHRN